MKFCWECFRSDSTSRNLLRLFGTKEMAEKYGLRGRGIFLHREKGNPAECVRNPELAKNIIGDYGYYELCFYTGDFKKVKAVSKNPEGSLGWSGNFIPYGIRLILLYLYETSFPSKAAKGVAAYVGFCDEKDSDFQMAFERDIIEESRGESGARQMIYQQYKKKFPRHSSFQAEMRNYFGM